MSTPHNALTGTWLQITTKDQSAPKVVTPCTAFTHSSNTYTHAHTHPIHSGTEHTYVAMLYHYTQFGQILHFYTSIGRCTHLCMSSLWESVSGRILWYACIMSAILHCTGICMPETH